MPRRSELRGVAHDLLAAFVSRNNDVEGYWALGRLHRHVIEADVESVWLDLMKQIISPASEAFAELPVRYRRMLDEQLAARRLPPDWVKEATIQVTFSGKARRVKLGDAFDCAIAIIDDRGRSHVAKADGVCWAHDPGRELRSTRG